MATADQADPRWIVNDMGKVGTNVGRWHWTEQNVIEWCKKRLAELLTNQIFYEDEKSGTKCQLLKITHVKGDAYVANRKRKLITFYQLDVSIDWTATITTEATPTTDGDEQQTEDKKSVVTATGKVLMPYISDENDMDDFEIKVSLDSDSKATKQQRDLKDLVYKQVPAFLRPKIVTFLTELKAGANVAEKYKEWESEMEKMDREKKNDGSTSAISSSNRGSTSASSGTFTESKKAMEDSKKSLASGNQSATVKMTEKLRGHISMIYDSFLDSQRLSMMTRAPATVEKKVGGKVTMFGASVVAEIVELEENKKIVQKWRFQDWPADCWSKLSLTFDQQGDMCVVSLVHSDIVSLQDKRVEGGWRNIFNGLKMILGQVISSGL